MAVVIDENLTASPASIGLPSGPIVLRQTLHSDLGGEPAQILYSLSISKPVAFRTQDGPAKQIRLSADIPEGATEREDTVELVATGDIQDLGQVMIKQLIEAETTVHDNVTLTIQS
jgi:hypothetical protein